MARLIPFCLLVALPLWSQATTLLKDVQAKVGTTAFDSTFTTEIASPSLASTPPDIAGRAERERRVRAKLKVLADAEMHVLKVHPDKGKRDFRKLALEANRQIFVSLAEDQRWLEQEATELESKGVPALKESLKLIEAALGPLVKAQQAGLEAAQAEVTSRLKDLVDGASKDKVDSEALKRAKDAFEAAQKKLASLEAQAKDAAGPASRLEAARKAASEGAQEILDLRQLAAQISEYWLHLETHGEDLDGLALDVLAGTRYSTLNTGGGFFGGSVFVASLEGLFRRSKPYQAGWWELKGGARLQSLKLEKKDGSNPTAQAITGARSLTLPFALRGFCQYTAWAAPYLGAGANYVDPRGGRDAGGEFRTEPFTQRWAGLGIRFTRDLFRDSSVQVARFQDPAFQDPRRILLTFDLRVHTSATYAAPRSGVEALVLRLENNRGFKGRDETTLTFGLSLNPAKVFGALGELASATIPN